MLLFFSCISSRAVCMDTSSVSEQERQSLEAVSRSESTMLPLVEPESEDVWSLVLFELPVTASSSGSAGPLMGLEKGWRTLCLCSPEPVPVSGIKSGIWSLPHVKLCSLPASTLGEVMWVLLMWGWSSEPLGEWSHFSCEGMARRWEKGCSTKGVPDRGMSGREDTGRGEVPGGRVRSLEEPGTAEP